MFSDIHNSKRGDKLYNFHPKSMVILLSISLFLLYVWYASLFVSKDYNFIALYFSIIIFIWVSAVFGRYLYVGFSDQHITKEWTKDDDKNIIIEVPDTLRCLFGESTCKHGNVVIWTVFHVILYIIAGILIPGHYLVMLLISILCEAIEASLGITSKFIIDPLFNIFGYLIGNLISMYFDVSYKNIEILRPLRQWFTNKVADEISKHIEQRIYEEFAGHSHSSL
jgi:hypothetical protein